MGRLARPSVFQWNTQMCCIFTVYRAPWRRGSSLYHPVILLVLTSFQFVYTSKPFSVIRGSTVDVILQVEEAKSLPEGPRIVLIKSPVSLNPPYAYPF